MKLAYKCEVCGIVIPTDDKGYSTDLSRCPVVLSNGKTINKSHRMAILTSGDDLTNDQKSFVGIVETMSNAQLYEAYTSLIPGDDYDGCFTRDGDFQLSVYKEEFETRLRVWLDFEGRSIV